MHSYRKYNKLGPVSFWPTEFLVSDKWWCSCSKLIQHAKLSLCLRQPMKKLRFQLNAYFLKSALWFFRIGSDINVFHWNGHVAIYFRPCYADKWVKGPEIDQQMWRLFVIFDQTEPHFLALYYQYMLQQCQTWHFTSSRMCHWWKISLSTVKWE